MVEDWGNGTYDSVIRGVEQEVEDFESERWNGGDCRFRMREME